MSRIKNTSATVFLDGLEIGRGTVEETIRDDHEEGLHDWEIRVSPQYGNAEIARALNPARSGDREFIVKLADGREGLGGASRIAPGMPIVLRALSGLK